MASNRLFLSSFFIFIHLSLRVTWGDISRDSLLIIQMHVSITFHIYHDHDLFFVFHFIGLNFTTIRIFFCQFKIHYHQLFFHQNNVFIHKKQSSTVIALLLPKFQCSHSIPWMAWAATPTLPYQPRARQKATPCSWKCMLYFTQSVSFIAAFTIK